ncbi:MAG: L-threonylcarbamoyladenylate synthase [Candidatus Thalassarchaeaceae archaeon]|jgi:L-threonylcarbamoyladenylate synthase|nr:L-threonylcarbamoyladenylate synthase [Candidatus Thalassarchaeaceae archaeon]
MEEVVESAKSGRCVVYPTSTLPALGCIPQKSALDELFSIKRRSACSPVSLGVADIGQAREFVEVPDDVLHILEAFPRGSLSIILRAHEKMDPRLGGENVAIRVVSHPKARQLLKKTGALTATSANISGEEPLNNCVEAASAISSPEKEIVALEGTCEGGAPSTLIAWHTVCGTPESLSIEVVREGKVSSEDVVSWWKRVT